jgi:hypothetical protein
MKYPTFTSISALALVLSATASVAGAQLRTSQTRTSRTSQQQQTAVVVCRDGAQVSEARYCNTRGGVDAQATQRLRSYGNSGSYGTYGRGQTQQNGSWKVDGQRGGTTQGNGSWKTGNGQGSATNGRYDGTYGQQQQRNGQYDGRRTSDGNDARYDSRRDDDAQGHRKQHGAKRGKHKGQADRDRDDRDR